MLWILLAIAIGSGKVDRAEVDMIELNHKCSENECVQFDQVIIWKWSHDYRRYDAQHWFIPRSEMECPVKVGEFYQCFGYCSDNTTRILFRSKMYRETWTTNDPERENLKLFQMNLRTPPRN